MKTKLLQWLLKISLFPVTRQRLHKNSEVSLSSIDENAIIGVIDKFERINIFPNVPVKVNFKL